MPRAVILTSHVSPQIDHHPPRGTEDPRIRRSWLVFAIAFFLLGLIAVLRLWVETGASDWAIALLVVIVGFAAVRHRMAVQGLEAGRRAEAESFARILQGLSRSVSPDAIVAAIVEELGVGTGADHVVIVRRRPDARVLEATLVNARSGGSTSSTLFPIGDLEDRPDPVPGGRAGAGRWIEGDPQLGSDQSVADQSAADQSAAERAVADRIAARARKVFGLRHSLVAPLTSEEGMIGALLISRRTAGDWPPAAERLLIGAAVEASAALSRVYSHRQAEARASTDALTGLPNRRYFDEFCGLLARRRRAEDSVGVLMVDIDHFKALNDRHGHPIGDEVLRAVAGAIVGAVREDDVPARYGGEEFAVLLRNPTHEVSVEVGERVRQAVGRLDLTPVGVGAVSVSIGTAVAADGDVPIGDVIQHADAALYEAKRAGRDRVVAAPPVVSVRPGTWATGGTVPAGAGRDPEGGDRAIVEPSHAG